MVIDTSDGGCWRQRASSFDSGDGRRWPLVFDGHGDGQLLRQQWTVNTRYGVQWRRWGGGGAINGGRSGRWCRFGGNVKRKGVVEAKMAIYTCGGGCWRQRASSFDSGDGRRWPLAFDGCGDGQLLRQQWTVNNRYIVHFSSSCYITRQMSRQTDDRFDFSGTQKQKKR